MSNECALKKSAFLFSKIFIIYGKSAQFFLKFNKTSMII